jgi:hypothetical protein
MTADPKLEDQTRLTSSAIWPPIWALQDGDEEAAEQVVKRSEGPRGQPKRRTD